MTDQVHAAASSNPDLRGGYFVKAEHLLGQRE